MRYRPEIDGLRAVAVLSVAFYHAQPPLLPGGYVGVDVFFVISGFLIAAIIKEDIENQRFSIVGFYERRARRILPALFFVILCCLPFAFAWMLPAELRSFGADVLTTLLFSSNIKYWFTEDYFGPDPQFNPIIHTWSLGVEEQFYILFPLLLFVLYKVCFSSMIWCLVLIFSASLIAAQWAATHAPAAAFYLLPFRTFELLIGAIAAIALGRRPLLARGRRIVAEAAGIVGLSLIVASFFVLNEQSRFPGFAALPPTIGTVMVIAFATSGTTMGRLLGSRPLVAVGLISYSLYLWHQPVFAFFRLRYGTVGAGEGLALILLATALATVTWRWVEQPFRQRTIVSGSGIFWSATLSGSALAMLAVGIYIADGWKGRVPPNVLEIEATFTKKAEERHVLIGTGTCHFNINRMDFEGFLRDWRCDDSLPGRTAAYAVVGDSHGADKAAALRLNGIPIIQMTGGDCSVSPDFMSPDCRILFDRVKEHVIYHKYDIPVLLSNRFSAAEMTQDSVESMIAYWNDAFTSIVFLGNMPTYPNLQSYVERALWLDGENTATSIDLEPDTTLALLSEDTEIASVIRAKGAAVVSTKDVFCAISGDCGFLAEDGQLLLIDKDHLSPEGARRFGHLLRDVLEHSVQNLPAK